MGKKRILIIDDDVNATRILKQVLERTGDYMVREVNHSSHSRTAAREFRPHAILLDVCMPGADGGDVALMIRNDAAFKTTPIVFLTSIVSNAEAGATGRVVGGFPILAKPTRVENIIACLEHHLEDVPISPEASQTERNEP